MATEGLQEGCDVNLLEGFLTVVHGRQDVLGADVVGLLQASVHTCRAAVITMTLKGEVGTI